MLHFVMLIIGIKLVDSDTEYLTFKDCQGPNPKKWRAVNEDKDYQIYWSGNATVPSCQLVFHGWNRAATKELDKYKICIEATTWDIKVSDLYLIYYTGRGLPRETTEDHRYSKGTDPDPTTKWCAESREVVAIRVVTWTWRMEVNLGFITLKVTAIKTHDYTKFVMTIVGPVVGGIIIVSIFIYCCVRSHRKGRREEASINYRNYVAEILRSENNDDSPIPPGRQSPNQQSTEVFPTPTAPPCLEINGSQNIETVGSTSHEVDLPPPSYETIGPAPPTSVPPPSYESVMNKT